jgi:hypothetical protein
MSRDGRFVAFSINYKKTFGSGSKTHAYVYDRDQDEDGMYDEPDETVLTILPTYFGDHQYSPDVSDNGRYISYHGYDGYITYAFVYDMQEDDTKPVSVDFYGNRKNNSYNTHLSSDGRYVAYESSGEWLPGDTNGKRDIFLYDRQEEFTYLISTSSMGESSDGDSRSLYISDNAQFIVYDSYGTTLVSGDEEGWRDVFATTMDIQAPEWPQGSTLSVKNVGQTVLTLEWTPAEDAQGVKYYRLYSNGQLIETLPSTQYSYNLTGLTPGMTYTFYVEAGDNNGNWSSGPSETVTTMEDSEGEATLTATAKGGGIVELTWDTALDRNFTGYRIYREDPEGNVESIDISSIETGTYTDSGLRANTTYLYQVFGVNSSGGEAAHTAEVPVTTTGLSEGSSLPPPIAKISTQLFINHNNKSLIV